MTSPSTPVVSVVTPTRNRSDWLERALQSFKAQTFDAFEVIVVDDGSNEETWARYPAIWDKLDGRFRLEQAAEPGRRGHGAAAARNVGLKLARGEFIAFCDDDDRWLLTDHLEVALRAMSTTGADLYITNLYAEKGERTYVPPWLPDSPAMTAGPRVLESPAVHSIQPAILLPVMRHHPNPDGWVVRRTLLDEAGLFWERLDLGEDLEMLLRLVDKARRILYRPDRAVGFNVTPRDSLFKRQEAVRLEAFVQTIAAAIRVSCIAEQSAVRRCAHSVAAWNYRQLALDLLENRRGRAAVRMAWQAVSTYPTLGGWRLLTSTIAQACRGRGAAGSHHKDVA